MPPAGSREKGKLTRAAGGLPRIFENTVPSLSGHACRSLFGCALSVRIDQSLSGHAGQSRLFAVGKIHIPKPEIMEDPGGLLLPVHAFTPRQNQPAEIDILGQVSRQRPHWLQVESRRFAGVIFTSAAPGNVVAMISSRILKGHLL